MRELSITEASYINMQRTYSMNGQLVNHIPDTVEVIRCKDCKHYQEDTDCGSFCNREKFMYANMTADDYCSYAERRES